MKRLPHNFITMKPTKSMKKNLLFLGTVLCLTAFSCVDGYHDNVVWSSSVHNITLESPAADQITIQFSADGTGQTITWPLVTGAGGYRVTVYNVDDPVNPILVGEENEVVDGVTTVRPATEDTRYKVVIKTLGNPKNNNLEAASSTEKLYDNLLPVTAVIPDGTNLKDYFTTNPIPSSATELCYELVSGGTYTMSGNVSMGQTKVTIRGNKISHPKITVTDGSFVNKGVGFKLKFIDLDYANFTGGSTNAVILMDVNFPTTGLSTTGYQVIPTSTPIAIQSCKITGLKYFLFYDSSKKYAIGSFLIKDCIIGRNVNQTVAEIRFGAGIVKDLAITKSTIYSEVAAGSNRFCQIYAGAKVTDVKPATETWTSGSLTITNCTFYQSDKTSDSFNSNGALKQLGDKITIMNNIFVDSYNQYAIRRFRSSSNNPTFTGGYNSYWFDGNFPTTEETNAQGDNSGTIIKINPQLTYLGNAQFTLAGPDQIAARIGDPRWLPAL